MSSPVDRRRAAPVPARRAFTLVELVIVVMVLGVLTGVAAPRLLDLSQGAQVAAIVRHLRVGEDAALRYYAEHGRYPADASRGVMPPELSD
ncbi:MAG: type II secretion system protein, partial [Planctomycetota bacterium]